jgi:II/X family phage/plasmid replication protein
LTGFGYPVVFPFFDPFKEYQHAGMIDWLTLRICLTRLPSAVIDRLRAMNSMIFKVNALTGDVDWQTYAWESVRSDTHQVCFRVGADFHIQGSPARIGLPNNAFGSLDIRYCADKMIAFAADYLGVNEFGVLPPLEQWSCSRIDVTRNYLMQSDSEARQALAYLKQSPESRQKHSYESNGFYIGKGSTLHRGKIYLKGQDAKRNQQAGRAHYTEDQLHKSQRLLRAELTLARHSIRRLFENSGIHWYDLNPEKLLTIHDDYFSPYFSEIEVTDMSNVLEKLISVCPTEGQARAAYDCYVRIRMTGYEQAKTTFTKPSWHRHISHLKAAGFKRADLQMINIIPLQKRAIHVSQPVRHWDDIQVA